MAKVIASKTTMLTKPTPVCFFITVFNAVIMLKNVAKYSNDWTKLLVLVLY